ncbi:MarR family winged helix-turn-helix transcriptional regulator [Bifidobacterium myosotis]|uniref:MarR family transcriptional regulator n=1 Tax=Bifidobacterium myosotis TaxID=1630166 RepID=A0A5M9ZQ85_9BIFI|nr:helix-turn-helix domain-containing protein [Bifidobacterium myosotis]KAA8829473.1 MarR family transcriptional regulator [Bifidobacterium myosotis]
MVQDGERTSVDDCGAASVRQVGRQVGQQVERQGEGASIAERLDRFFDELHRIDVALADYGRRLGLSDSTMCVLDYLNDHDGVSQREICDYTMLPRQTVNNVISSFMDQGYIRFGESEGDRRVKTVWFTESGRRYCNALIAPERGAEYRAMSELDPDLRDAMIRGMEIFGREFRRQLRAVKL